MSENLADFLFDVFCIFVFAAAISLFMLMNIGTGKNISLVKERLVQDNLLYESDTEAAGVTVSGAEIIAKAYGGLDVDIFIDGRAIKKEETASPDSGFENEGSGDEGSLDSAFTDMGNDAEKDLFNGIRINPRDIYIVEYRMDDTGKVTGIEYIKV